MNRSISKPIATLLFLAVLVPTGVVFATHGHGHHCNKKCVKCPKCKSCQLDVSADKEKKTCFEVEQEQICIPRFVFPWQNKKSYCGCGNKSCSRGCASSCSSCKKPGGCSGRKCANSGKCGPVNHNGACVRTVNKLKKSSHECPKCKYEWSIDDGKGSCTMHSCTNGSCTMESCTMESCSQ